MEARIIHRFAAMPSQTDTTAHASPGELVYTPSFMKSSFLIIMPLAVVALVVLTPADAQIPSPPESPAPSPSLLAKYEESYVANLMQDCVVEGRVANAARNRATKPDVRELGASLGTDYPKLAEDLSLFAVQKGIKLPADLEASHQKLIDALSSVSVDEFDSAYLALVIDNHVRYVAQIEPILRTANDADLKAILAKTLTHVTEHLAQAKAVQKKYAGVSVDAKAAVPK
jgi:putative membrane protein